MKNQISGLSEYAFQWYYALADGRISIKKGRNLEITI